MFWDPAGPAVLFLFGSYPVASGFQRSRPVAAAGPAVEAVSRVCDLPGGCSLSGKTIDLHSVVTSSTLVTSTESALTKFLGDPTVILDDSFVQYRCKFKTSQKGGRP